MIKIVLEPVSNGVIKTIKDDNTNGAGEEMSLTSVHEIDDKLEKAVQFLYELSDDLGLSTGNKYDEKVINITLEWGSKYEPSREEVEKKIEELSTQIEEWKSTLDAYEV